MKMSKTRLMKAIRNYTRQKQYTVARGFVEKYGEYLDDKEKVLENIRRREKEEK